MVLHTDIERMYRAGKELMPATAIQLGTTGTALHDLLLTLDRQAALAGDPQVLRTMLQVGGDTYDVLRGAVTNLRRAAEAVILTADDFRSTDQQARDDFAQMDAALRNRPAPAAGPALPAPGDPEHPGSVGTPSTPAPQAPAPDRADRLHAGEDPADHWGQ